MSKKRSISKKINLQSDFPLPETSNTLPNCTLRSSNSCIQEIYFGERIKSESCSSSTKTSDISEFYVNDEGVFYSKSSASSTSDSEDIETEATKKVSCELEKIEHILYGEQEHATNVSQKNEFNQWIDNFPHLRIIGKSMKIHPSVQNAEDFHEEIIAEHYDRDVIVDTNDNELDISEKIKETVINSVFAEIKSKLFQNQRKNHQVFTISDKMSTDQKEKRPKENEVLPKCESFLQVSSIPVRNSPLCRTNFEYQSPIMKSHLSAAKWQREDSFSDYSSLPHISQLSVPYSSKKHESLSANKSDKNLLHCSANSRKKSGTSVAKLHSKYTHSPRLKNVVLPPIQNLAVDGDFRSVSSTPNKFNNNNKFHKYSEIKHKTTSLDKN